MVRMAAALFLAAHGFAHVIGFLGSWRLGEFRDAPYSTLILGNNVDVGDVGIRIVGLCWLVAAFAFGGAALAVALRRPHWARTVSVVTVGSIAICFVGLPAASAGLLIDLGILMAVAAVALQPGTGTEPRELRH